MIRRPRVARIGIVVFAIVAALLVAGSASAHATLVSSSPAPSSVLESAPHQIALTFDEAVDTVAHSIRLVAADGSAVDIGDIEHNQGASTITATVPDLADGTYVVAWHAISADSHPVSGAFTFSVRSATATAPGLVAKLLAADHASGAEELGLGIGRWMSYAGLALLLGTFAMLALCAPGVLRGRRAAMLLAAASAVGIAGTALMIAVQSSLQVGHALSPSGWRAVAETHAGRWWAIRLGLFVAGLGLVPLARRVRLDNAWAALVVLYGGALLAVVAAGGHGISGRWVPLGFVATMAHLGAMSLWVGGLVALLVAVPTAHRWAAAARFSRLAFVSVVVLAASGTLNAWRQAGSLSALTGSTYGVWLYWKLGLVAAVVIVASFSRRTLRARAAPRPDRLRRLVAVELVGIVAVLGATAGLVSSAPPREVRAAPLSVSVVLNNRIAQVVLDPPVAGGTTMHVYLSSVSGSLDQPTQITVTADLPAQSIVDLAIPLSVAGPGHLTSPDANLPVAGAWTIVVTARYSEFDQVVFRLPVQVR